MRVALFGGTYDPVHRGHLSVADEVLQRLNYDQIWFVPAKIPPHKTIPPCASAEERLHMLKLATDARDDLAVDDFELRSAGISYTIRTLRYVIDMGAAEGRPGLIIGQDLADRFDQWREADAIEELADIILVSRSGTSRVPFPRRHILLDNVRLEVSSTEVRERASAGESIEELLDEQVYAYIQERNLYLRK